MSRILPDRPPGPPGPSGAPDPEDEALARAFDEHDPTDDADPFEDFDDGFQGRDRAALDPAVTGTVAGQDAEARARNAGFWSQVDAIAEEGQADQTARSGRARERAPDTPPAEGAFDAVFALGAREHGEGFRHDGEAARAWLADLARRWAHPPGASAPGFTDKEVFPRRDPAEIVAALAPLQPLVPVGRHDAAPPPGARRPAGRDPGWDDDFGAAGDPAEGQP